MLGEAKRKLCNCKNSRCLKLYCECFASGVYCDGCNCIGCCNNPACDDVRRIAIEATLERNPTAFRPKIAKTTTHSAHLGAAGGGAPAVRHNKGCHCKKSSCLKKYCECFQAGIVCSQMCKCVDCRNFEGSAELASLALNAHVAPTAPSGAAGACASPFHAGRCSPSPMQRGGDSARPSPNTGVKRPRSADRGKGDMTPGAHTGGAVRAGTGGGAPSGCPSGCPTPARADATDAAGALATAASLVQSAAFGIGVARAASPAVGASACGQCGTAAAAAAAAAAAMAMASPARLGRQDAPGASPFPPPLGVSGGLLALSGTAGGATRCAGAGAMGAPVASGGGSGSSGGGGGSAALCSAFTQHRLLVAAEMMLRAALGAVASGQPQLNAPRPAASAAQPAAHAGSGAPCAPPARPPATADAPRGSVCNGHDGACSRTPSASPSCFALLCDEETPTVTAAAATDTAAAAAADQDGAAARGAAMAAAMAVGDGCMEADCVTGGGAAGWLADRSAHLDQIYAAQERAVLAELNATLRTLAAHARRKVVGAGGGCSGSGAGGGSGGAAQLQLPPRASPCAASPPAPPAPSPARGAPGARPPCGTPCRSAQPAPPTAIAALGAAAAPCARPAASCVREPVPVAAAPLAPCGQLARAAPAETPPLLSPVEERRERGGEAVPAAIARLPVHAVQQQQLARPQPQRTQPPPVQQPLAQPPDDALVPRTAGAPLPAPALPRMSPPGAPAAMRSVRQALPPETATNGAASGQTGAPGLVRLEQQGQRQPMAAAAEVTALPAAATAAVFAPTPMPMVAPGAASARALAMAASLHCAPPPGPHSATG
ncbi:hypothetical protein KFE25_010972 [Diacronema lutheri]|uniref:CRC domain-containing protein n=1 Tax=Diacronema lutheri TaxID=2081491 RepID=A0A8J6C9Z1_DIALT|nr:hypothetical protein KFE25_010972 [Diacronema lutheri]